MIPELKGRLTDEDRQHIIDFQPTLAIALGLKKAPERCGGCGGYFSTLDPCVCC